VQSCKRIPRSTPCSPQEPVTKRCFFLFSQAHGLGSPVPPSPFTRLRGRFHPLGHFLPPTASFRYPLAPIEMRSGVVSHLLHPRSKCETGHFLPPTATVASHLMHLRSLPPRFDLSYPIWFLQSPAFLTRLRARSHSIDDLFHSTNAAVATTCEHDEAHRQLAEQRAAMDAQSTCQGGYLSGSRQ
jgi:hypothetical protein